LIKNSPAEQKKALSHNLTQHTRAIKQDLPVEGNLRERLVYLIKSYEIFAQVSHNQWDLKRVPDNTRNKPKIDGPGFGSFEDIHNTIHRLVGGNAGHMSNVAIAAFDPIFWLHHT
jgi:tyrosinase